MLDQSMVCQNLNQMRRGRFVKYNRLFSRYKLCISRRSGIVNQLVGVGTRCGKRAYIFNQVFLALVYLKEITHCISSIELLESAVRVLEPPMECRKTRRSGRPFYIPVPCRAARRQSLGIRFLWYGVLQRSQKDQSNLAWSLVVEVLNLVGRTHQHRLQTLSYLKRTDFLENVTQYLNASRFLNNF